MTTQFLTIVGIFVFAVVCLAIVVGIIIISNPEDEY